MLFPVFISFVALGRTSKTFLLDQTGSTFLLARSLRCFKVVATHTKPLMRISGGSGGRKHIYIISYSIYLYIRLYGLLEPDAV